MKKTRFITSQKEVRRYPLIAALLSFFFTGAGQLYAGFPISGAAMMLGRGIPLLVMPLYVSVFIQENYMSALLFAVALSAIIWILSPAAAFCKLCKNKNTVKLQPGSTPLFIALFAAFNIVFTAVSIAFVCAVFGLERVHDDTNEPNMRQGEIVLLYKKADSITAGNMIAFDHESKTNFSRLAAAKKTAIRTAAGRIYINNKQLEHTVNADDKTNELSDAEKMNLLLEKNGLYSYQILMPIQNNLQQNSLQLKLADEELFTAKDNRLSGQPFALIQKSAVLGRIEGIIVPRSVKRICSKMYLD